MAQSSCPKCENDQFELVENDTLHEEYTVVFVQCNSCGAVVGVMNKEMEEMKNIKQAMHQIDYELRQIKHKWR